MFGNRQIKRLEKIIEEAALVMTMNQAEPPVLDERQRANAEATVRRDVIAAASSLRDQGEAAELASILTKADTHPMFRGDDPAEWTRWLLGIEKEVL